MARHSGNDAGRHDDLTGRVLDDRYRLEARIGAGGMGEVYRGRHLMMDQRVAIKLLRPDLARDPNAAKRFAREAKSTFRLDHANCVRVTDLGATADGLMYLVMEYLDGRTLGMELRHDGPVGARRAVHMSVQVCAALGCAHDLGLVHRDLKPDNLMLVQRGADPDVVKVLDFGLAKIITDPGGAFTTALSLSSLTREGVIFGTPEYMSPEQAVDDELTARSDLYALGVVLYEMLTGAVPFHSVNPMEVLAAHVSMPAIPPHQRRPDLAIPPGLSAAVMRLLDKDPSRRPENADVAADELRRALTGVSPKAGTAGAAGSARLAASASVSESVSSSSVPSRVVPSHVAASSTVDLDQQAIERTARELESPEHGVPRHHAGSGRWSGSGRSGSGRWSGSGRSGAGVWILVGLLAFGVLVSWIAWRDRPNGQEPAGQGPGGQQPGGQQPAGQQPAGEAERALPVITPGDAGVAAAASRDHLSDAGQASVRSSGRASGRSSALSESSGHPVAPDSRTPDQAHDPAHDPAGPLRDHIESAYKAQAAGNVLEQMAHADSALRLAPNDPQAAYLLGDALIESDPERACRYLKKARRKLSRARKAYARAGCGRAD